jgi:hypothetical protein
VDISDSLSGFFLESKETNKNIPLTAEQQAEVERQYDNIQNANTEYKKKITSLEAKVKRLQAERKVNNSNRTRKPTNKTHEEFVQERTSLKDKLKQIIADAKAEQEKNDIKAAGITVKSLVVNAKIAKVVTQIAASHLSETALKFNDLIDKVYNEIKDIAQGITKNDVIDIMAGEYNEKLPPKSELAARLEDIRIEAQLIKKYEKLVNGEFPKTEKKKIQRNRDIEELRKKIKALEKLEPTADQKTLEERLAKLKTLQAKNESEEIRVREAIAKGEYAEKDKSTPLLLDDEIRKAFPEDFKSAKAAKDKLVQAKKERRLALLLDQQANMTTKQKAIKGVAEVFNIPRGLMASGDLSAMLRQAIIPTVSHPFMAARATKAMFQSATSQTNYDTWFYDLSNSPRFELMELSRLAITDSTSPELTVREESFMSNLAEKVPLIGSSFKVGKVKVPGTNIIKGSERAYTMYLNHMRVDLFNRFADSMEDRGLTWYNNPTAYKQMAAYVNNSTGRGDMGKTLNNVAPLLNSLFFSPRLIASRINMLTYFMQPRLYGSVPKEVRKAYFVDMAKFIGLGITVMGLASMGGDDDDTEVEKDPRSSDFGKIKNKDTRWDIWGGYQQYIRVAAQVMSGERKASSSGKFYSLDGESMFGQTKSDVLLGMVRGKLAPVPAMAVDIFSGRNIIGEKVAFQTGTEGDKEINAGRYFMEHLIPLNWTGLSEALDDQGVRAWFTVGVPSTFGIGTQTFPTTGWKGIRDNAVEFRPETRKIKELYTRTRENTVLPSNPPRSIRQQNHKYDLQGADYEMYKNEVFKKRDDLALGILKMKGFDQMADEDKIILLKGAYSDGLAIAKAEFMAKHPELFTPTEENRVKK